MGGDDLVLRESAIRLEPLAARHADGLVAASASDPELYRWSAVPLGQDAVERYIDTATACSARQRRRWRLLRCVRRTAW